MYPSSVTGVLTTLIRRGRPRWSSSSSSRRSPSGLARFLDVGLSRAFAGFCVGGGIDVASAGVDLGAASMGLACVVSTILVPSRLSFSSPREHIGHQCPPECRILYLHRPQSQSGHRASHNLVCRQVPFVFHIRHTGRDWVSCCPEDDGV